MRAASHRAVAPQAFCHWMRRASRRHTHRTVAASSAPGREGKQERRKDPAWLLSPLIIFQQKELEQCWRRYVAQESMEEKTLTVSNNEEEVKQTWIINWMILTKMRAMDDELTFLRDLATVLRGDLERALEPRRTRVDDESSCCYRQKGDDAESCGDNGVLLGASKAGRVPVRPPTVRRLRRLGFLSYEL
ncbi:hypothetical protein GUJ93_ZPchr0003g17621 [Zizania palustris]|uniref:Uncharacterized protein n=1 Tax=Zizania palustris TaxID=103762 RepID=A0A8J5VWT8_ZIZPA|nr:hypothetical protein GUJ93_ZPchr0003g17621 [Zizania palustris]